jgi:hypothetical protein
MEGLGIRDGKIGAGAIGKGGCEGIILCLEARRYTVPPAVTLKNFMRSGTL